MDVKVKVVGGGRSVGDETRTMRNEGAKRCNEPSPPRVTDDRGSDGRIAIGMEGENDAGDVNERNVRGGSVEGRW
jgi:hypothetical protein